MRKHLLFLLILTMLYFALFGRMYTETPKSFDGYELASRSTDPRITEIAHTTTTPTLNSYELEVKTLWDSLFINICAEYEGEKRPSFLDSINPVYWLGFTPKELLSKEFHGVKIFYMQNLESFKTSIFMCALYKSKIYLMPIHANELMKDMGIDLTPSSINFYLRKYIDFSISSQVAIVDSSVTSVDSIDGETSKNYKCWEQRNGVMHIISFRMIKGTSPRFMGDYIESEKYIGPEVIADNDNRVFLGETWDSIRSPNNGVISNTDEVLLRPVSSF
jgi:hypothetical protein